MDFYHRAKKLTLYRVPMYVFARLNQKLQVPEFLALLKWRLINDSMSPGINCILVWRSSLF